MTTSNNDITGGLLFLAILMAIPAIVGVFSIYDDYLEIIIYRNSYFKAKIKIDSVVGHSSESSPVIFYGIGSYKGVKGSLYLGEANEDFRLGKDSIRQVWIRIYKSFGKTKLILMNRSINQEKIQISHLFPQLTIILFVSNCPFYFSMYLYLRSKKRQRLRKIQNEELAMRKLNIINGDSSDLK